MNISEIISRLNQLPQTAFGTSVPAIRKLAKTIARDDYRSFILQNQNQTFELRMLHAFVIGYAKDDIEVLLNHFKNFIPYVNDWAINDSLCQNFTIARQYQARVWSFVMNYANSQKEFESRIVSVILLSHYLNDEYIDRVISTLNKLYTKEYYASMSVAWALATVMARYPQKCLDYLQSPACALDPITYKRTLQKIRESFRVSADIKELTKSLKK